jgi:hypothetical protein
MPRFSMGDVNNKEKAASHKKKAKNYHSGKSFSDDKKK